MQFECNLLTTTALNSTSQNKKTVQTVLILGLFPHHGSCHVFSLPVEQSVPEQRASNVRIHPVLWHLQGLSFTSVILPCSQTFFDSPNSSAWYFRPSTLTSAGLSSVLSHQSFPKVQPHGAWLSPSALRNVPFCAFACAVTSTPLCLWKSNVFFTVQFKCHCLMETLWSPTSWESAPPLCPAGYYWHSLTGFIPSCLLSKLFLCTVSSVLYPASLYFVHLCISQRALQPLDTQSVDWMAVSAGRSEALIPGRGTASSSA